MREAGKTAWARAELWLRVLLTAAAAAAMAEFAYSAWLRAGWPYEFEWIEDGVLASVRHVAAGLPLYGAPSVMFTPYLYTPLYIYLAAGLAKLTGAGYAMLRGISAAATLGSFAAIYALVKRETGRRWAAAAGAGLFAACYYAVDGAYDVGRVDSLWVCLMLWAAYATRRGRMLAAAALWVLAFQTKQAALPIAVLFLLSGWRTPKKLAAGMGAFAAGMAATIAWMNAATAGWYGYYVFGVAGGLGFTPRAIGGIVAQVAGVCGIGLAIAAAAVVVKRPDWRGTAASFYTLGTAGMMAYVVYLMAHRGANTNVLMPLYAWAGVLFGVGLGRMATELEGRGTRRARMALAAALLLAMGQMAKQYYRPREFQASKEETALRNAFEARLRAIPGDVLVPGHPEYGRAAGKAEYAGSESAGAVLEAKDGAAGDRLRAEYAALIDSGRLSAVALDQPAQWYAQRPRTWMPRDFQQRYPLVVTDAGGEAVRFTSQPKYIYLPCAQAGTARMLDAAVDESACSGR